MAITVNPVVNSRRGGLGMLTFAFVYFKTESAQSYHPVLAFCFRLTSGSPLMCSAALQWELSGSASSQAVPVGEDPHPRSLCTAATAPPAVSPLPRAVGMQFACSPLRMGKWEAVPGMWNGHKFPRGWLLQISCWGNHWNNSFKYLQVLILLSQLPPFTVVHWS